MAVLKDGESSKGDERNKKGGVKGKIDYIPYFHKHKPTLYNLI